MIWSTVPDVSGTSAEVKAELDEAVFEGKWDEVTTRTLSIAVVENKSVVRRGLDDHLDMGKRQHAALQSDEL